MDGNKALEVAIEYTITEAFLSNAALTIEHINPDFALRIVNLMEECMSLAEPYVNRVNEALSTPSATVPESI